ncbi:MAG: hypothetical protein HY059_10205 [Proteobacteria bacterium]|nr:hypothetical protein [Pseudomonadota bacterium]
MAYSEFVWNENCEKCGHRWKGYEQMKGYGSMSPGYTLGSSVEWTPPFIVGARDRKLRYFELGSKSCPACKEEFGLQFLIIRRDVFDSIYTVPDLGDFRRVGLCFKSWEAMVMVRTFGAEKVRETSHSTAIALTNGKWEDYKTRLDENAAKLMRAAEADLRQGGPASLDTLSMIWSMSAEAKQSNPFPPWAEVRDYFLNCLFGTLDFMPSAPKNVLRHTISCPSCERFFEADFQFPYGPCNAYVYRLGSTIEWSKPGRVFDLRDDELHYVNIVAPKCGRCGYVAVGVATVEGNHVEDIFIWPNKLWDLLNTPPPGLEKQQPLDMFLTAREFGVGSYYKALQGLYKAIEAMPYKAHIDILGQARHRELNFDFQSVIRRAFKEEMGREYS